MTYQESKVGFNTAIAGIIALIATKFGIDVPNGVAVAAVGLTGIITAYFSPGWAGKVGIEKYPAGTTAALLTVLSWLLPVIGVDAFSQADLVTLVGAITLAVGVLTPANDPEVPDPAVAESHERLDR